MSHFRDLYLANKKSRDARRRLQGFCAIRLKSWLLFMSSGWNCLQRHGKTKTASIIVTLIRGFRAETIGTSGHFR
ncbi:hypothetical protein BHF00_20920 [Escherichia coli]|nr:hypothetical protein BHF00_20920 [Escherichia coli]